MSDSMNTQPSGAKLLHCLRKSLRREWMYVFPQSRTREKAIDFAICMLCLQTRQTVAQSRRFEGKQHQDWTASYTTFSQSPWSTRELFECCLVGALARLPQDDPWCPLSMDDTRLYKTSTKTPMTQLTRDAVNSPAFRPNFRPAQRFLHAAIALPLYKEHNIRARAIPTRFEAAPWLKKPGKKATEEEIEQYKQDKREYNLSVYAARMLCEIRKDMDKAGASGKVLLTVADGSFCNSTLFKLLHTAERIHLLARARKDASLCMPAPEGSHAVYAQDKFTPESVRHNDSIPWQQQEVFYGGQWRTIRFKRADNVLWQGGAKRRLLSLFVIEPIAYRTTKTGKTYYRQPAYLLTTATKIESKHALQKYLDRWQIEVAHRELKQDIGVGKAQVHSEKSVPRLPSFLVACYSMLQLAALECYGPTRTENYPDYAKWEKRRSSPSCRDIKALLRQQWLVERALELQQKPSLAKPPFATPDIHNQAIA